MFFFQVHSECQPTRIVLHRQWNGFATFPSTQPSPMELPRLFLVVSILEIEADCRKLSQLMCNQ